MGELFKKKIINFYIYFIISALKGLHIEDDGAYERNRRFFKVLYHFGNSKAVVFSKFRKNC
jgi:hypothetical protein